MTVEPRVVEFLSARRSVDFCDACLASALGAGDREVEAVSRRLNALPSFLRDTWRCSECGRMTVVTRALRAGEPGADRSGWEPVVAWATSDCWRP